jgi:hypothetical protein
VNTLPVEQELIAQDFHKCLGDERFGVHGGDLTKMVPGLFSGQRDRGQT